MNGNRLKHTNRVIIPNRYNNKMNERGRVNLVSSDCFAAVQKSVKTKKESKNGPDFLDD